MSSKDIEKIMDTVKPMDDYKEIILNFCKNPGHRISTGLPSLDKTLSGGLSNELYIMGAETSTGKSAFLMSVAQKIAERGTKVLYFSLEMGRSEFVARGISAISFEQHRRENCRRKVTADDILHWTYDDTLKDFVKLPFSEYDEYAQEYFSRYGKHLHIIEGGLEGLTVKDIAKVACKFKEKCGSRAVIFVDYLQLIKADSQDRSQSDRKTKTDVCVTTLKALASHVGMSVIAISSISRKQYGEKVGTASFKESGDTEYTGGVLLGWNWLGVTGQSDLKKAEEEKKACEERGFRRMKLEILKNRNSRRDVSVYLKYYPAYHFFEEDDGWERTENNENPFDL